MRADPVTPRPWRGPCAVPLDRRLAALALATLAGCAPDVPAEPGSPRATASPDAGAFAGEGEEEDAEEGGPAAARAPGDGGAREDAAAPTEPESSADVLWRDAPASPVGRVVTTGNDASGFLQNWDKTPWNVYGGGRVSVVADATHGRAVSFFGAGGRSGTNGGYANQRAEQVPPVRLVEGLELWFGMDVWLSPGIGTSRSWQGLFQVKNDTEGSPTMTLAVNEHEAGLSLGCNRGPSGTPNYRRDFGAYVGGAWTRVVMGFRFGKTPETSWVEGWRDGANVVPREPWRSYNQAKGDGARGGLLYGNARSGYLKVGLYRGPAAWDGELRTAHLVAGRTRAAVMR